PRRPLIGAAIAVETQQVVAVDRVVADADLFWIEDDDAGVVIGAGSVAGGRRAPFAAEEQSFAAIAGDTVVVDEVIAAVEELDAAAGVAGDGVVMNVRDACPGENDALVVAVDRVGADVVACGIDDPHGS